MTTDRDEAEGFLARSLSALSAFGCRRPWLVVSATLLSCVLSLGYACLFLRYENQRNDLHHKERDYYRRWQQYVAEFGDDDDMVVVVEGKDRRRMEEALEALAAEIARSPELFDRLFYKVDLRALRDRALLFLPADQIRAIQGHLNNMALLLDPPVLGTFDPLFGWKSLTLVQLLREGERRATAMAKERGADPAQDSFLPQLNVICRTAAQVLQDSGAYTSPWQSIVPPEFAAEAGAVRGEPEQRDLLERPQYFFSGDGTLAFLLVRPFKEKQGFTFAQKSIDALRSLADDAKQAFPDLDFGVTGLPVLENDEMVASQKDSTKASWLALIGVALLYLVVYRGLRYPFMTVATLLVGTAWALGWLTLTVGHLNILSSAFAVMLIGMGDYGVLWVTRFGEERRGGRPLPEALARTAASVGPSIMTAALTTALAFFAAMLANLRAVAELGWIAGSGVLLCALACFLLLPALLTLLERRPDAGEPVLLSLRQHQADHRPWLPWLAARPALVLSVSAFVTLVLGYLALQGRYDHNLLHLQAQKLPSVQWEQKLIAHTAGASWHALSYTTTPEEALALKERFEKLPDVSRVVEVAALVPRDQERKLEQLRDICARLRHLPPRGAMLPHAPPTPGDVSRAARALHDALALLPAPSSGAQTFVASLQSNLRSLQERLRARDAQITSQTLQRFEERLAFDLAEDLHRLRDVSTPRAIDVADLPACLRERYLGKNGKWLLRVFARDCLWDFEPLERFTRQVASVDPEATGKPFTTLEGLRAMKNGFQWAGVYALVAMVLVLLLDFGNVRHTLLALLPLAMGMIGALGILYLTGTPLNPANMIAFPLILGVGADNGVHVLHDYRSRQRGQRYWLSSSTGRGIMVAALTTILGFGTLMFAQHRGMASLGLALTLGVSCCMLTALVFLPALLSYPRAAAPAKAARQQAA